MNALKHFHAWFTEPVAMPRAWFYIAVGFAVIELIDLAATVVEWLA